MTWIPISIGELGTTQESLKKGVEGSKIREQGEESADYSIIKISQNV